MARPVRDPYPRWGVIIRFGRRSWSLYRGWGGARGSTENASMHAPAIRPDSRAFTSAASSTTAPLAVLTRIADVFIFENAASLMIPLVAAERGVCRERMSDPARSL